MHAFRKLWNKIKHFSCGLVAVISIAMISFGSGYSIFSMRYEGESMVDPYLFKGVLEEHGYTWKGDYLMDIFTGKEEHGSFTVNIEEPFMEITRTYKVTFSSEEDRRKELLEIINLSNLRSLISGQFTLAISDAKTAILRVRFYTMTNLENLREKLENILMNIDGACYDMEVTLKDRFEGATLLQIQDRDEIEFMRSYWTRPISAPAEFLTPVTPPSP